MFEAKSNGYMFWGTFTPATFWSLNGNGEHTFKIPKLKLPTFIHLFSNHHPTARTKSPSTKIL
jgi:hypothetical protein